MNNELSDNIIGFPTCAAGPRARFRVAMCSKNEVLAVLTTRNAKRRSRDQGFRLVAFAPTASNRFRNVERLPKPRFCCTSMRSNVRGGREERARSEGGTRVARRGRRWRSGACGDRKEQATRTGAKVARRGRRDDRVTKEVERALGPRGAGAHGGRRMRATRAHRACEMPSRARAVAGRARLWRGASPTPRAGARPPRRASSSPEATCPSSRAP